MDNTQSRFFPNTSGLVERTLNVDDIIESTRHSLLGEGLVKVPKRVETYDDTGKPTTKIVYTDEWRQVTTPFMTREGVETIISQLRMIVNQINMGSNLPEEKASLIAYTLDISIDSAIAHNSFRWRVDAGKMRLVCESLRAIIYMVVYRSVEGWMIDKLTSMTTRMESTENSQPQPTRSLSPVSFVRGLFR